MWQKVGKGRDQELNQGVSDVSRNGYALILVFKPTAEMLSC